MSALNWGMIQDGGVFESLMHAILFAEDAGTILFGRPGKDSGQDARSADGTVIYQAKYRQKMTMDVAVDLAHKELPKIKKYCQKQEANYKHWKNAHQWILVGNFSINPNDIAKWKDNVVPAFQKEGLAAEYWGIEMLEGKLAKQTHVRKVFFEGENRVLVGLKEAHDLLAAECVASDSLEVPMSGRNAELNAIRDFAESDDNHILPIVGTGGIGKSRLLYESLVSLGGNGWRVLWALPGTMARSSRWFHILNDNQRTLVAIDDPDDHNLVRTVVEQLATTERRNWKVILACRSEKTDVLRRLQGNRQVAEPLTLPPLDAPEAKQLLQAILQNHGNDAWCNAVYKYTRGIPGWLCLIAELVNRGSLPNLPANADEVAVGYVDSCLQALDPTQRKMGRILLRWLALWGSLSLDANNEGVGEIRFLANLGITEETSRDLLHRLAKSKLVRNWGVGNRMFAVEPLIIREHILSEWLLENHEAEYRVSAEGNSLVSQMVKGEIPAVKKVLHTLSHLSRSRLDAAECFSFFKPVFDNLVKIAREDTVLQQHRLLSLLEQVGAADPERVLDVLAAIRENPKEDMTLDVPLWGEQSFTHADVVSKLPWALFEASQYVSDPSVAQRFLEEFRKLFQITASSKGSEPGKGVGRLLERLLCRSRNQGVYSQPACKIVDTELRNLDFSSFAEILLECLLNPEREYTDWAGNWTIKITMRMIVPGSSEWEMTTTLRAQVITTLQTTPDRSLCCQLWQVLARSHNQFHRFVLHGNVKGAAVPPYRKVLLDDLSECLEILRSPPIPITIGEATHARELWSWYLEYGGDDDLMGLASQCEDIYNGISKWQLHNFFQFAKRATLEPETQRIARILKKAADATKFEEFFAEANRYLKAVRHGDERDGADWGRISDVADALFELFDPTEPSNALTSYVLATLDKGKDNDDLAWQFMLRICKRYLCHLKATGNMNMIRPRLEQIFFQSHSDARLLYDLYSRPHPESLGQLTNDELDIILTQEKHFSPSEWFTLLGGFASVQWDTVRSLLYARLYNMKDQPKEASDCMACFVRWVELAALRYRWSPEQLPTGWVIDMITQFDLNGALLEMSELNWLRENSDFNLSMRQLASLIQSRIELEQRPRPYDSFRAMPFEFSVSDWCRFDMANQDDVSSFFDFCRLVLASSFTAIYRMPKYVAQFDPSGQFVKQCVEQYLRGNSAINAQELTRLANLASGYQDSSQAWRIIALPICEKAQGLRRQERERVYYGLSRKETGVISSACGEVPEYYIQVRDNARRMLDAERPESALKGYRERALRIAEAELQHERESAEEECNG